MNGQKSQANVASQSINGVTTLLTSSNSILHRQRILQNSVLIWLDVNFDQSKEDYQDILMKLQNIVHDVRIFVEWDEAIDFITDHEDIKTIFLTTATISLHLLTVINDIQHIDSFYILFDDKFHYEGWTTESKKFKGIYTDIKSLCQKLEPTIEQYNQNSTSISFLPVNDETVGRNLNQLDPSFMYTQIFKEILLDMTHDEKSRTAFISFWRQSCTNNPVIAKIIDEFERDYCPQSSIWWYTRTSFIYEILNQALRTLDSDTIINMGFFIHDLHKQLEQLHREQINNYGGQIFQVYRGQGLSKVDFDKLVKSKEGLMSFNSFLSTSTQRSVSLIFAGSVAAKADAVGILFNITIDPSMSVTPSASIQKMSYYQEEDEILFSMHTIFRIHDITKIEKDNTVYEVHLTITEDNDKQLRALTNRIREEVARETGWSRLGALLIKIGQVNKAEELYHILFQHTSDQSEKNIYLNNLAYIKAAQGDYPKALSFYEKALAMRQKSLPPNHPDLATSYNNIAAVHYNMGDYSKAFSCYGKSLEMRQKALPPNHPDLATSYNNIAALYNDMGDYPKSLSFYEKALEIGQKALPPNHPSLATSYNNIAAVHYNMGHYPKSLSFYEKALEMRQKSLPPNHSSLATSYNNMAMVHHKMGDYPKSLSFYEKALEIFEEALPPYHPHLATSYNNMAMVHHKMGDYPKSLSFYEKALEIFEEALPPYHPHLATSYNNMAMVHHKMGDYPKSLSFYEKALEIFEEALPPYHPHLATSYNNIAAVHYNMGHYPKSLSCYEKALEIFEKALPPYHPHLATSYSNIAAMYYSMGDYSKARSYFEHALNIFETSLPSNHPNIQIVRQHLEMVKQKHVVN